MNRYERRKAARKPLAAKNPGLPIFTGVLELGIDGQTGFFWIASDHPNYQHTIIVDRAKNGDVTLSGAIIAAGGPFATAKEANAAAQAAVVGDCKVTPGGAWDPAWSKPQ